jgi:hypothetical protein
MSMRGKHWATVMMVCVVSTWVATGCGKNTAQAPTPSPTHTVDVSPPANPVHDTVAAQALKAAEAYFQAENELSQNPNGDLAVINTVASGQAVTAFTADIQDLKSRGIHIVGAATILTTRVTDLSVTGPNASVAADMCFDVSKTAGVDAQGRTVTAPARLDHQLGRYTMTNTNWPDASGWRVTSIEQRNQPCTS